MKKMTPNERRQWVEARKKQYMERDKRLSEERAWVEAASELIIFEHDAGHLTGRKKKR